jgi:cation/acetate symporter
MGNSSGKLYILFAGAFLAVVVVLAILGQFGLPDHAIGMLLAGATLIAFAVIGAVAWTMQSSEFYLAGRSVPPMINGMATAAAFLSGATFLGLASAYFEGASAALTVVLGWSCGFLLLAVLIAPYFRESGAHGVADFLAFRFDSRLVGLVAVAVVVVSLIPALAAAIATAALVGTEIFGISEQSAFAIAVALLLFATLLGGMRGVTTTTSAQYIVVVLAVVIPVAVLSATTYRLPVPQFTLGSALEEVSVIASRSADFTILPAGRFMPMPTADTFPMLALILSLAAGVATLPHLLIRGGTVKRIAATRRSVGWSLLFVLLIVLTVPAYAAFARLALLKTLVGTRLNGLPDWIFVLGQKGLVQICGVDAVALAPVRAACLAAHGPVAELAAGDLAFGADAIVLAWPDIVGFPYVVTALIAVGTIAAALSAGSALLFTIASALGHDLYGRLINRKASAGRRLIVTRLAIIGVVLFAAWLAAIRPDGVLALAFAATSISAACLFAPIVLGIWWKRTNAFGAFAGMLAGFAAAIVARWFSTLSPTIADMIAQFGNPEVSVAIIGLPISFIAVIVGSALTPRPSEERSDLVDAIRRPSGSPFVQEGES